MIYCGSYDRNIPVDTIFPDVAESRLAGQIELPAGWIVNSATGGRMLVALEYVMGVYGLSIAVTLLVWLVIVAIRWVSSECAKSTP